MKKGIWEKLRQTVLPVIAAIIWGGAFAAQSICAASIGPFTFNSVRSFMGVGVLLLVLIPIKLTNRPKDTYYDKKTYRKRLLTGGITCGIMLTVATNLQQYALSYVNPGKAAFITALYLVIVPIIAGLVFKLHIQKGVAFAVVFALCGMYLLSVDMNSKFVLETGDIALIGCALAFAIQIITIDRFSPHISGIEFSAVEFLTLGICSGILALIFEKPQISDMAPCIMPLLYVGLLSTGVAYTLQVVAQKGANPTVVSILMSLESLFGAVFSAIFLPDTIMSPAQYLGCALMLIAVMCSQIPEKKKKA